MLKGKIQKILKNEYHNLFKKEFGRNFLTLFSGTSFSQVIPIIVSPILTRLFTPEDFGLLALFTSTVLFFGNISTLQYDLAIMLPKKDEDALNLMALSLTIVLIFSIFSTILVTTFKGFIYTIMGSDKIGLWLYFVPISVFLTGLFKTLNIWTSRNKKFKRLAVRNIVQSTVTSISKAGIGSLSYTSGGLIIGSLLGQFVGTITLLSKTLKDGLALNTVKLDKIKTLILEYKDFPIYSNLQGFVDSFKETGLRYIISSFYGTFFLGGFSFTTGLLQKPLTIVGSSISQVYFQKANNLKDNTAELWLITKKIAFRLILISLTLYLPILLWGPKIFKIVFGLQWENAGKYAQILVPWFISKFVIQTCSNIPQIFGKQKEFFKIGIIYNLLYLTIVFIVSKFEFPFNILLIAISIYISLTGLFIFIWFRYVILNSNKVKKHIGI